MDKKVILIAEDEIIPAYNLKLQLESLGYEVGEIIPNGEEIILKAISGKPDLILMDIYLDNGINGIQAVKEIHVEKPNIPVIYITASNDKETFNAIEETNYYKVIPKPYDFEVIKNAIENLFRM